MADVDLSQFIKKSRVGVDGYGADAASSAMSLDIIDPVPDELKMIAHDHISGQTFINVLVAVVDAFNQRIIAGVSESGLYAFHLPAQNQS